MTRTTPLRRSPGAERDVVVARQDRKVGPHAAITWLIWSSEPDALLHARDVLHIRARRAHRVGLDVVAV